MPWQEPKTTWAAGPGPTKDDLNRMEGNAKHNSDTHAAHVASLEPHGLFGYTTDLVYTSGKLTRVDEKISNVLRKRTTLTYTGEDLTGVNVKVYAENGTTVVSEYNDVLTYTSGSLSSVQRAVV